MNKVEFIQQYQLFLSATGLTAEEAVVGAGGAMLLHGLRTETRDIDMDVPAWFYHQMLQSDAPRKKGA